MEKEQYTIFNKAVKTFIRDLIITFPSCKEFTLFLVIYKMSKSISKKTPHRYFKEILLNNYREYLLNEDDTFFKSAIFERINLPIHIKLVVQELKGIYKLWNEIDHANKKIIWSHIHGLIQKCDNCEQTV